MFLLLPLIAKSLRPLIIMPGLYGSNLYATYTDFAKHWYCPKTFEDEIAWVDAKFVVPPLYNCLFEMLACRYDEETQSITSQTNIDIHVHDFGGVDGISKVAELYSWKLIESFGNLVDFLKDRGYEVKKNLFGAPYDWRFGVAGLNKTSFFLEYQQLVEQAYEINGKQKVVLLGYSLGTFVLSHFLGRLMTPEWKEKYIERIILLAPALAGSGDTLPVAWNKEFPLIPLITNDIIKQSLEHIPVIHGLFPNHVVYAGDEVIRTPEGQSITPEMLPDFLVQHGKYSGDSEKMLRISEELSKLAPADPGVDMKIIYNSALPTSFALNFIDGFDQEPEVETVSGDGTVPSKGPEWIADNWNLNGQYILEELNLMRNDDDFDHMGIGNNAYVNQLIFDYANKENNRRQSRKGFTVVETAPYVELTNTTQSGYIVREDVRLGSKKIIKH
ncbi:Lecithin:cholesterol acyltransferase family protein [Tritrichomonas foetus]|uniref:Lecithin:cholesterol acyltransferase family protein n=1 Tax=Tritrichomonas foetus TaxID=1144522 RepID=A0A1J4K1J5_9EUKA|nr:Lecithin:cholesterol acyltransferase family protein [Tritrichomonas foetus]|eukprot:OHT03349.1 Lecithin:cholesterol acyltransferase family protein [Tritrichomonas foetus]